MTKTALQQLIEDIDSEIKEVQALEKSLSGIGILTGLHKARSLAIKSLPTEKQQMEDFAKWYSNLLPTQKCTIHPPAGSGAGFGLYEKSMSDLFDKYLNEHNNG